MNMNLRKRRREPDEAHERTNKRHRAQKKSQDPAPLPPPNQRNNDEPESGMPGSPSNRVPQAGSHRPSPVRRPLPQPNSQRPEKQPGPSHAVYPDPGSSHSETSTCYAQKVTKYDVEPGVQAIGSPDTKELDRCEKVTGAAEFMSSKSGLKGDWVGVWPLGKGGNGIAGLWELRDHDGRSTKVCSRTP